MVKPVAAQTPDSSVTNSDIENVIEDIVGESDQEFQFDTYAENLELYRESPLDLNEVDKERLESLGLLNDIQIESLLHYRHRYGEIHSIYELLGIPHFNPDIIHRIEPFVATQSKPVPPLQLKKVLKYGRHDLFLRNSMTLVKKKGYSAPDTSGSSRYLGNPMQIYLRYKFHYHNRIQAGITAEKDPGEAFFSGNNPKGFDFYSGHFFYTGSKAVQALALGDYAINTGQGLVLWSGFGFGKSTSVLETRKSGPILKPYSSAGEYRFFRGAATTLRFGDWKTTVFASAKASDGNLALPDTIDPELQFVSSLQETGLHRTPNELADKNSTWQYHSGVHLSWSSSHFDLGMTGLFTHLSKELIPNERLDNQFAFRGNQLINGSVDYNWMYHNMLIYGETAISNNLAMATLNGLLYNLDDRSAISILFRHYDTAYQSLLSNSFAESSGTQNETGLYLALETQLSAKLKLKGFIDMYRFPWLSFTADAPSAGHEWFGELDWQPMYGINASIRYRNEQKWKNLSGDLSPIDHTEAVFKSSLRFDLNYQINVSLKSKTRVELSRYSQGQSKTETGFLAYQDFSWSLYELPLKISARYALFDISDYHARIYAYESDVLYAFSVPAYQGRGGRIYALINWKINPHIQMWFRISNTWYLDRNVISSGLEEIAGNKKPDARLQFRFNF